MPSSAVRRIEYDDDTIFLSGIRHVQKELRFGGSDDTAASLRGSAAFGLVRIKHPDVMLLLADLLADQEKASRIAAVQALGGPGPGDVSGFQLALPALASAAGSLESESTTLNFPATGIHDPSSTQSTKIRP